MCVCVQFFQNLFENRSAFQKLICTTVYSHHLYLCINLIVINHLLGDPDFTCKYVVAILTVFSSLYSQS